MMARTAIVTGGSRGLGMAIAADLAQDHNLVISYNTTPPDRILALFPNALAVQADLQNASDIERLIDQTIERFGQIDVLVNNAGTIAEDHMDAFDLAEASRILSVNTAAPMALLARARPFMKRGSAVVNITSQNARLPAMSAHSYSASKAALEAATRIAAKTLGPHGIRVNAVAPGAVNTPENPRDAALSELFLKDTALNALATPEDIANAVRFLCSDGSKSISGEILTVSGGYRL